ncbi:Ig-like domain repeat protein [Sanguibacter sp. HDW7]|nr:Ig-like domain repeat protein [Sanguibacter sp. HDW7]
MSLVPARSRISYGATTQVKVRVVGATAAPSGTVGIYDGSRRIASARLVVSGSTGRATVRLPKNLAVGTHSLRAVYSGSRTTVAGRSATVRLVVAKARPSMSASVRSNWLVVRVAAPGLPTSSYVTVKVKGRTIGRAKVVKGVAKIRLTSLPAGKHTLSVRLPSSRNVAERTIMVKVKVTKRPTVVRVR